MPEFFLTDQGRAVMKRSGPLERRGQSGVRHVFKEFRAVGKTLDISGGI